MDINPYRFEAPFDAFEFSRFHVDQKSRWILFSMAWLKAENGSVLDLLNYWTQRLKPFFDCSGDKRTTVVICNRVGSEKGTRNLIF